MTRNEGQAWAALLVVSLRIKSPAWRCGVVESTTSAVMLPNLNQLAHNTAMSLASKGTAYKIKPRV